MSTITWGIVSTIKAPVQEILNFCAHHLDLGAQQIFVYLDDDNQAAIQALSGHPQITATLCTDAYWQGHMGRRPKKHQARQVANAAHAYDRAGQLDWLAHIDVDEFLWPESQFTAQLAALPETCLVGRIRPAEALANPSPAPVTHFKRLTINRAERDRQSRRIYPTYGMHLNGGFLSHVQGKLIYRTGIPALTAKIHNVFVDDDANPGQQELTGTELLHLHAQSREAFLAAFQFRLKRGSYRSELKPATQDGVSMHTLFRSIYDTAGDAGLGAFYDEVCTASPDLLQRLRHEGLLSSRTLDLDRKRQSHFPRA